MQLYLNPKVCLVAKGEAKPEGLADCKHVISTQPGFEVGKPLECSKAKEASDCKIKPRMNAACCVVANVASLPGLLSNEMSCGLKQVAS